MTTAARRDCLVVGAGVVGLAVALALARRNQSVTVLERAERCGEGASAAAAGMLAAGSEAGEPDAFQALCRAGRQLWPGWAEQLRRDSGIDCELELTGLVRVATTEETARGMEGQARWQREHGLDVSELLDRARLAELVPGLGPAVLAGLHYPGDGHVHSHRMVDALLAACLRLGVTVETGAEVQRIEARGGRPRLILAGGELAGDYLVISAGSWSADLLPLPDHAPPRVEPVRGQIVALDPGRRVLPLIVFGDRGYLLQKRSGLVLAGATEERVGYKPWPTLAGVRGLTAVAEELLPELAEARFAYAWAGLRPHAGRGWPLLGRIEQGGRVLVATGHFRNGVLLAPITGDLIAEAVVERRDPIELEPFSPALSG